MNYTIKIKLLLHICLISSNIYVNANTITLTIKFDDSPNETSWNIKDDQDSVIASGGLYTNSATVHSETINLITGSYTFTINDSGNNGICCSNGDGHYTLIDENGHSLAAGGPFGASESSSFTIGNSSPQTIFVPDPDVTWYFNPSDFVHSAESVYLHPSDDASYLANVNFVHGYYGTCRTLDRLGNQEAFSQKCVAYAPSPFDEAKSFFGTYVPKSGATVTFWVKLIAHEDNTELIHSKSGQNHDKIFEFGVDENTLTYYEQRYKSSTSSAKTYKYVLAEPFTVPDLGKWYFVAMSFDPFFTRVYIAEKSTGDFKCHYWWDGFYNHPDWDTSSKWSWYINSISNSSSNIDDVMVWYGHKLSKTQIDALFECQKNGIAANCLGDIPMPPGSSTTAKLINKNKERVGLNEPQSDIENEEIDLDMIIFPNPTDSDFTAQFNAPSNGDINIELIDLSGHVIFKDTKYVNEGTNQVQMSNVLSSCGCFNENAVFIFRVTGKDFTAFKKVIIK